MLGRLLETERVILSFLHVGIRSQKPLPNTLEAVPGEVPQADLPKEGVLLDLTVPPVTLKDQKDNRQLAEAICSEYQ